MAVIFTSQSKSFQTILFTRIQKSFLLLCACSLLFVAGAAAQCNLSSSFTKITNTAGTVVYPGTDGNRSISVTTIPRGDASVISYCAITNGYRAGQDDNPGAYKFTFSPGVNGIKLNINSLSNVAAGKEKVVLKINGVVYTVTAADIACAGNCFGCTGSAIFASGGSIVAKTDPAGNGVGQVLIQGVGPIRSIEYINRVVSGDPQGSVFEIFFNNSTCALTNSLAKFATQPASTEEMDNGIRILSNPVRNALVISGLKGVNTISVYNAAGTKTAGKTTGNGTETIDAGSWTGSLYMVVISDGKTVTTKKIIKL